MNRNVIAAAKILIIVGGGAMSYGMATMLIIKMERDRLERVKKKHRAKVMQVVIENTDLLFNDIIMENF